MVATIRSQMSPFPFSSHACVAHGFTLRVIKWTHRCSVYMSFETNFLPEVNARFAFVSGSTLTTVLPEESLFALSVAVSASRSIVASEAVNTAFIRRTGISAHRDPVRHFTILTIVCSMPFDAGMYVTYVTSSFLGTVIVRARKRNISFAPGAWAAIEERAWFALVTNSSVLVI